MSSPDRIAREAVRYHRALQDERELTALLELVSRDPPRTVLEIGLAFGGTLWAISQVCDPEATLFSIDLPEGPFSLPLAGFVPLDVLRRHMPRGQTLISFEGDSSDTAIREAFRRELGEGLLDLLFVDGDHTYDACLADVSFFKQFVRPGGLIVLHDISHHPTAPDCQVERVWKEMAGNGYRDHYEFVYADGWGGIGVARA